MLQQNEKIYYVDEQLSRPELLFRLKRSGIKAFLSKFGRLGQRAARGSIRAGIVFENVFYFSDYGVCYGYDFGKKELVTQQRHRPSMRSPLMYCAIEGIDGFDNQVCYGEYFGNEHRESVKIWHKVKGADSWSVAAAFKAGQIRHIHGIFTDKWRSCVYILTGDADEESAIWIAKDNFKNIEKLISGGQQARSCQIMANQEGFLYCTDSEYEQNALYDVVMKETGCWGYERKNIFCFDGSIIYGCASGEDFFFSTTVEPDKGGIKSEEVKCYYVNACDKKVHEIFKAKKDILPAKLFQYGYARMAVSKNTIAISFCGVKKYDGRTIILKKTEC